MTGECVTFKNCPFSKSLLEGLANPDDLEELQYRKDACHSEGKIFVCCEKLAPSDLKITSRTTKVPPSTLKITSQTTKAPPSTLKITNRTTKAPPSTLKITTQTTKVPSRTSSKVNLFTHRNYDQFNNLLCGKSAKKNRVGNGKLD